MKPKNSLVMAIALIGFAGAVSSDPMAALTLGVALDHLTDQLNQTVLNARNAGSAWEMQAGGEVAIAVANARNAYADSLNITVNQLNPSIAGSFSQLQTLVNDFTSGAITTEADAMARAQVVVAMLPLHNGAPQLAGIVPRFVVPSKTQYPVRVIFRGAFERAAIEGYKPSLTIGGKAFSASTVTNQELVFTVPVTEIFPAANLKNANFDAVQATLNVPWEENVFLNLWTRRVTYQYPVTLNALPASPGKLILTHTEMIPMTEIRDIETHGHVCSTRECGNNDQLNVSIQLVAHTDSGWALIPGTCKYDDIGQGERSHDGPHELGDRCVGSVTTIHKKIGSSGSTDWTLRAKERKTTLTPKDVTETVDVTWGETRSFGYPATKWTLSFDAFSGAHHTLRGTAVTSMITTNERIADMSIKVTDAATLNWSP